MDMGTDVGGEHPPDQRGDPVADEEIISDRMACLRPQESMCMSSSVQALRGKNTCQSTEINYCMI